MNIAYLCSDFGVPVHGRKGASIHVREVARALRALGHQVEIITCRAGGPAPDGFAVPVHDISLGEQEKLVYGLLQDDPAAGEAIAKEVRSALYASLVGQQAESLLRRFRPDAIYERYSLFGTAGMTLAKALQVPHILEVNAPLSEEQAAYRGLAFGQTARAIERTVLCSADQVIVVSSPLKEWMVGFGVEPERVRVLPNGVDVERFAVGAHGAPRVREQLGLTDGRPVLGFVGTLKAWHGTATLLRAVAKLHREGMGVRLVIVGEGPERASLEALAVTEGIAGLITFTGAVPHEWIPAHVAAFDVAVAPYDQAPNFYFSPLKLFEYMAAGRPVVAAAIGQLAEFVRNGETGLLYPPGDVDALAASVRSLVADREWASALGRAGQAYVGDRHTWLSNAQAVVELVRKSSVTSAEESVV